MPTVPAVTDHHAGLQLIAKNTVTHLAAQVDRS
jgi:hypothetical protein